MSSESARPLLITSDGGIVDAVVAVASEAGVELTVAPDLRSAGPLWASAPLVLCDAHQIEPGDVRLGRRGVVVVSRQIDSAADWRRLVGADVERIVELPSGAPWLYERIGRGLETEPDRGALVVMGCAGGAGTSTVAAALASHAGPDGSTGVLVDLDPGGSGLDLMLGGENEPGARWDELAGVNGRVDDTILVQALPRVHGLPLLSWPPAGEIEPDASAVGHVLDALLRCDHHVVVDVGRGNDPRCQVALARAARVVLVVPLRVRAIASARRVLQRLPQHLEPCVVVREPAPAGLTVDDVSQALEVEVTARLGHDRRRATDEELGGPPPGSAQWRRLCELVLAGTPVTTS